MTIKSSIFKKYGAHISILAAALVLPILAFTPAAQASSPKMCERMNSTHCWSLGSSTGAVNDSTTSSSVFELVNDPLCGGSDLVTSSCPFVVGSGLNGKLVGHTIIKIVFPNEGSACADSTSAEEVQGGDCNGSHAAYVPVDGGLQFISVGASNEAYNHHEGDAGNYIAGTAGHQLELDQSNTPGVTFTWETF